MISQGRFVDPGRDPQTGKPATEFEAALADLDQLYETLVGIGQDGMAAKCQSAINHLLSARNDFNRKLQEIRITAK